MWWNGRQLLQPDVDGFQLVRLDVDGRVVSQLGAPEFLSDSSGRVQIISKAEMRRKGLPSPDRAEAVLLALFEPRVVAVAPVVAPVVLGQRNVWGV
jgi:hypothetical protein